MTSGTQGVAKIAKEAIVSNIREREQATPKCQLVPGEEGQAIPMAPIDAYLSAPAWLRII